MFIKPVTRIVRLSKFYLQVGVGAVFPLPSCPRYGGIGGGGLGLIVLVISLEKVCLHLSGTSETLAPGWGEVK